MPLQDGLNVASSVFPAPLEPQKDGSLAMEALIAERKAFLRKRKLTCKRKPPHGGVSRPGTAARGALIRGVRKTLPVCLDARFDTALVQL